MSVYVYVCLRVRVTVAMNITCRRDLVMMMSNDDELFFTKKIYEVLSR